MPHSVNIRYWFIIRCMLHQTFWFILLQTIQWSWTAGLFTDSHLISLNNVFISFYLFIFLTKACIIICPSILVRTWKVTGLDAVLKTSALCTGVYTLMRHKMPRESVSWWAPQYSSLFSDTPNQSKNQISLRTRALGDPPNPRSAIFYHRTGHPFIPRLSVKAQDTPLS